MVKIDLAIESKYYVEISFIFQKKYDDKFHQLVFYKSEKYCKIPIMQLMIIEINEDFKNYNVINKQYY